MAWSAAFIWGRPSWLGLARVKRSLSPSALTWALSHGRPVLLGPSDGITDRCWHAASLSFIFFFSEFGAVFASSQWTART